ncbi:MAG: hypothetical protein HY736_16275 [Verrucomicrobia bacterium]|nr:hypothetical protein [Verrucomicrobiota bacterium]
MSHRGRVICIGGGDELRAHADVFSLAIENGRIVVNPLPSLPGAVLKMGGALLGDTVYVVGGRDGPLSVGASRTLWALDLSRPPHHQRWADLPECPGPGRMMPIAAAARGALYVFGGIEIVADQQGRPKNAAPYLRDAYRFVPAAGSGTGKWEKLADIPQPLAGAPSPAWSFDADTITVFGGVDGAIEAIADRGSIRELPGQVLSYHIAQNCWTNDGQMPAAEIRVNAPTVAWRDGCVIISGENLPARRTNACTLVTSVPAKKQRRRGPLREQRDRRKSPRSRAGLRKPGFVRPVPQLVLMRGLVSEFSLHAAFTSRDGS